jgi:NYN domain-containing protein
LPERVAVFLDYQNVHLTGHTLFDGAREPYRCVPHPVRLADLLASKRARPSAAATILVYRGQPHPLHQPKPAAANEAQASQWSRDRRVRVIRRQLNYRNWPAHPPLEKGIDVAIAVDMMRLAFRRAYDALVLFSGDTDLLPVVETIYSLKLGHVEVACWSGAKPLRFPGRPPMPWCHFLNRQDWRATVDDWEGRV